MCVSRSAGVGEKLPPRHIYLHKNRRCLSVYVLVVCLGSLACLILSFRRACVCVRAFIYLDSGENIELPNKKKYFIPYTVTRIRTKKTNKKKSHQKQHLHVQNKEPLSSGSLPDSFQQFFFSPFNLK